MTDSNDTMNDLEVEAMDLVRAITVRDWGRDADIMASAIELVFQLTERVLDLDEQNRQLREIIAKHIPGLPPLPGRV